MAALSCCCPLCGKGGGGTLGASLTRKSVQFNCVMCTRIKGKTLNPIMVL